VVCGNDGGYRVSLIPRRLYPVLPDTDAHKRGLVRVVDESGEDYVYPATLFLPIELPGERKAVVREGVVQHGAAAAGPRHRPPLSAASLGGRQVEARRQGHLCLALSVIVITSFSVWASLQCWPAQIGCHQPSAVGWRDFLSLFLALELGPLAPWYMMAVHTPAQSESVALNDWIFVLACTAAALLPWMVYVRTKRPAWLVVGTALWVFFGWMFAIGSFT